MLVNKKKTDYKVVKETLLLVMYIVQKEQAVIWALNIDNKILVFKLHDKFLRKRNTYDSLSHLHKSKIIPFSRFLVVQDLCKPLHIISGLN